MITQNYSIDFLHGDTIHVSKCLSYIKEYGIRPLLDICEENLEFIQHFEACLYNPLQPISIINKTKDELDELQKDTLYYQHQYKSNLSFFKNFDNECFILELCKAGYDSFALQFCSPRLKNDISFISSIQPYQFLFKEVFIEKILDEKINQDEERYNLWGQEDSYEHLQYQLTIDNTVLFLDKYINFISLENSEEKALSINIYLQDKQVSQTIYSHCDSQTTKVFIPEAFSLIQFFNPDKVSIPEEISYFTFIMNKDLDYIKNITLPLDYKEKINLKQMIS